MTLKGKKHRKAMPAAKVKKADSKPGIRNFMRRAPAKKTQAREKNTYYFRGFYDRLKSLDMKQSHSLETNHRFDTLLVNLHDKGEGD